MVLLASASPRRRELLSLLVQDFKTRPRDIDETPHVAEAPEDYVLRLARAKANAVDSDGEVVIGADTTVTLRDRILGKPANASDARAMLEALSGTHHWVHTAVAIRCRDTTLSRLVSSKVHFVPLSESLIEAYLKTDEPWDKAGSYGIQGLAGSFVSRIEGSYSAVVGLPLVETRELLAEFGVTPQWSDRRHG